MKRRLQLFLLVLGVTAIAAATGAFVASAPAAAGSVATSRTLSTTDIVCDGTIDVTVTLDGTPGTTGSKTDVLLVLDQSGSVNSTLLATSKAVANSIVAGIDLTRNKVGTIAFSGKAFPVTPNPPTPLHIRRRRARRLPAHDASRHERDEPRGCLPDGASRIPRGRCKPRDRDDHRREDDEGEHQQTSTTSRRRTTPPRLPRTPVPRSSRCGSAARRPRSTAASRDGRAFPTRRTSRRHRPARQQRSSPRSTRRSRLPPRRTRRSSIRSTRTSTSSASPPGHTTPARERSRGTRARSSTPRRC